MNLNILNGLTTIIIIEAQNIPPILATGSVLPTREQEPCLSVRHCVSCTYESLGSMKGAQQMFFAVIHEITKINKEEK